jgi:hypothetical protein
MLHLTKLRELTVETGASPQRPAYLSSASGLVRVNQHLYVVADDELQLGVFTLGGASAGKLLRLLSGELPDQLKPRKKLKPDFEVLVRLPAFAGYQHGALLALGSGSTANRHRGVLVSLDAQGGVRGAPRVLDVAAWFTPLAAEFEKLNLEGAFVSEQQFCLLQRGNKGHSANAVVQYDLHDVLSALQQDVLPVLPPQAIHTMQLGDINGIPLCFTDACALADGCWLFAAVAEDTDSTYDDGEFLGAVIGLVDASNKLLWTRRVMPQFKIEGIEVQPQAGGLTVLLVTDADNPAVPAYLLSAELALGRAGQHG